jgi:hypothetical protein
VRMPEALRISCQVSALGLQSQVAGGGATRLTDVAFQETVERSGKAMNKR